MEPISKAQPISAVPSNPHHPFYPVDSRVPGYVAISTPTATLLTTFFGGLLVILMTTRYYLQSWKPKLSSGDVWTASWFVLCGFIHTFFEGYFSFFSLQMGSRTDLFGQLWKEYSLSDSRYMTQDSFIICMETITAFLWGPLSFLCAYMIVTGHISRHPIQLTISLGQLYGLALYYATCAVEELVYGVVLSHPQRIYYWAYYVTCNAFWVFIPGWLVVQSVREIQAAFAFRERAKALAAEKKIA